MAQIDYHNNSNEIIIALGQKVVFFNCLAQKQREIILPKNLGELIPIPATTEEDKKKQEIPIPNLPTTIQHIKISPNAKILAVTTVGIKSLILYQICKNNANIISIRPISRASSAMNISPDSKKILICDKTGDCCEFDCGDNPYAPGKWILAHLSIVYDVLFTPDEKFIITSDRDEKIRTTNYPNHHEIESYCLGHEEYVGSLAILENHPDILISVSGDKYLKLWKWKMGIELKGVILPAAGVKVCVKTISENIYQLAVLVYQPNESIFIYELLIKNEEYIINLISSERLDSEIVTNICYIGSGILIASIYNDRRLSIQCLDLTKTLNDLSKNLKNSIEDYFKDEEFPEPEDLASWFKKKFNNLTNYFERKKLRIDEKYNKKLKN